MRPLIVRATEVTMLDRSVFQKQLRLVFRERTRAGAPSVTVIAGELHRRAGGYPGEGHRMPMCCGVMRAHMQDDDRLLFEPPKGNGATLSILYRLPRGDSRKR